MRSTKRYGISGATAATLLLGLAPVAPATAQVDALVEQLNQHETVHGSAEIKSFEILFDAYLEMTPPPRSVALNLNLRTIHPGMDGWASVSGWAEANPALAAAVLDCKQKTIFGLPYGAGNVRSEYREAGLVADIGIGGSLRNNQFPYLQAVDTVAAFVTAETYRLLEAGEARSAMDLAIAHLYLVRQYCDRGFLVEKQHSMQMLLDALAALRDQFYLYQDVIESELFAEIAWWEIPGLRPGREKLFMPEADRIVSKALLDEVFDERTQRADPVRFRETFAEIQAQDEPLTRFGAARRWAMIAEVHDSHDASVDRLNIVYNDWWRRWRVQEYDPILDIPTQFERTNAVRYAAVLYSMQNIEALFAIRNELIASVNGTALAAGLCAYRRRFGSYPNDSTMLYGQFIRKFMTDVDPFDKSFGVFRFRPVDARTPVDTNAGRVWIDPGPDGDACLLYSVGQNHENDRARAHTDDGLTGDIVFWPPMKALQREQGLVP
ncbi:MAG: hypothetical protein ACYTGG_13785 [Planctomycetota bacterium]|jgi:hypothetical protein